MKSPVRALSRDTLKRGIFMTTRSNLVYALVFLCAPLGLYASCAEATIYDQLVDGGSNTDSDGGTVNPSLSTWTAKVADPFEFPSETSIVADKDRRWKRDPHYVTANGTNYLFIAGGDSSTTAERWSLSYYKDAAVPTKSSTWTMMFDGPTSTSWDKLDVMAPFASYRQADGWTIYYAANGDSTKPDYVLQIGRATSSDLKSFSRASQPVIGTPNFTAGSPDSSRPDAYGATDPWILVDGSNVYMYYAGLDCGSGTCKFQILRSKSNDGGTSFPPGEVVLSGRSGVPEEAGGVAGPSIILRNGQYTMAYTSVKDIPTKDRKSIRNALATGTVGVAVSSDGKTFQIGTKSGAALVPQLAGFSSFRSEGAFSPTLYLDGNTVRGFVSGLKNDVNGVYYGIGSVELTEVKP